MKCTQFSRNRRMKKHENTEKIISNMLLYGGGYVSAGMRITKHRKTKQ